MKPQHFIHFCFILILSLGIALAQHDHESVEGENVLVLPELEPIALNGGKLKVIATTSIIGDIVATIGGDAVSLTTLIKAGQDPHSYEPVARDFVQVSNADLVFVNGWNLEEGLIENLETVADVPLVAVSANLEPLVFGEKAHQHDEEHDDDEYSESHDEHEESDEHDDHDEHDHTGADPHTWLSIHNVEQWVLNIEHALSQLDPHNADHYSSNAEAYLAAIESLAIYASQQLLSIPTEKRFLVTNHDSLGYLAHDYNFEVIATVIPTMSTLAEPSAQNLAALIEEMRLHNMCTIFAETISRNTLAQIVLSELKHCDEVELVTLYTGSLGIAGSGAETYLDMYRMNVDRIVSGLTK